MAAIEIDEGSQRRKIQRNGRKPDRSDQVGDKIAKMMASEEARQRSVVVLASLSSSLPALQGSSPLDMLEVRAQPA